MKKLLAITTLSLISSLALADRAIILQSGEPLPMGSTSNNVQNNPSSNANRMPTQFSLAGGYAGSKLGSDDFQGTESFDGVFVNAEYKTHPKASIWAEYVYQNSEVDYNQFAVGYKYKFLEDEKLYSSISLGVGYSWLEESETIPDLGKLSVDLDYFSIPAALEVGYKIAPQVDLFGALGYQWLFNDKARVCLNGDCASGKDDSLDLNGVTYKTGLRYNF